jgi:hypothetical protein
MAAIPASFGQTVKSLTLGASIVTGGLPDTGTVTLSAAAKSGGLKVSLKSNSSYVVVPDSVTVESGSKTASFTITTEVVYEKEFAFITASANGSSAAAELTLVTPEVTALSISPTSVICQQTASGTVTINVGAGSSGFNVALKSNQVCASVPAAIKIAPGLNSGTFTITTTPVTQTTVATITATGGGGTATATLTILPGNGLAPSGWSKFLANAGNSPQGLLPAAKGVIGQTIDIFSGPTTTPVVAPDGTVYVIEYLQNNSYLGKLRALTPAGVTKWSFEYYNGLGLDAPPIISPNGTIYVFAVSPWGAFDIYALSTAGKQLWEIPAGGTFGAADGKGNLYYVGGSGVAAVNSSGKALWSASAANPSALAVGKDGKVYVADENGFVALNPTGSVAWTKNLPRNVLGAQVCACSDGSICLGDSQGNVTDVNPSGVVQWSVSGYLSTLHQNPLGGIYCSTSSAIVSLSSKGAKLWSKSIPPVEGSPWTLAVGTDGSLYTVDGAGKLWAFAAGGATKWTHVFTNTGGGEPAVSSSGNVYVAAGSPGWGSAGAGYLCAVDSTGAAEWTMNGSYVYSVPSFGVDGTAYFSGGYGVTAVDTSGKMKWSLGLGMGGHFTQPTIASDGTIFAWNLYGLYAVSPTGTLKWFYPYPRPLDVAPSVGPDGTTYFADGNLYAISPAGTLKWSKSYADSLVADCIVIGGDGTLYVTSLGETGPQAIYAIKADGTLLWTNVQASPWRTMTLDKHGNIYTVVLNDMTEMDPNGNVKTDFGGTPNDWFVVGSDGTVCFRQTSTNDIVLGSGGVSMGSDWDPFAMASDDTIYGVTQTGGTVRAYSVQGKLLWSVPGVAAWTAKWGSIVNNGNGTAGLWWSGDRPFSISPTGSLYVRTVNGFVVIN